MDLDQDLFLFFGVLGVAIFGSVILVILFWKLKAKLKHRKLKKHFQSRYKK